MTFLDVAAMLMAPVGGLVMGIGIYLLVKYSKP